MELTRIIDETRLAAFLTSKRDAPLSYLEIGASFGDRPTGYHHDSDVSTLGAGDAAFRRAVQGLREWRAHRGAHVTVFPPHAPLEVGTTIALALPLVAVHALAACRVVAVVDEPGRFGFAYGTVEGHPEQGEEAFILEHRGDTVRFRVTAFSRPADPLARLAAPITRRVQRRVTRAYLSGLRAYVAGT